VFDKILIDAPCSNQGVLDRRPEARWRITKSDIRQLANLQYALLESASALICGKGMIVYSVCSPDPEETVEVIQRFLERHRDWKVDPISTLPDAIIRDGFLWAWPGETEYDGFFAARLIRSS